MPSGIINLTENDPEEDDVIIMKRNTIDKTCGPNQHIQNIAHSENNRNEGNRSNKGLKRGNYYHELWSDSGNSIKKKRRVESDPNGQDNLLQRKECNEEYGYVCDGKERAYVINSTVYIPKPKRGKPKVPCVQKNQSCRKPYYRKRRYCCPGKRRYKAKGRCCPAPKYNRNRINLCNRNWARISINPFINFLRVFRRKFCKGTPITEIARKGKCEWQKMSCNNKKRYYEQAKRARIRGYRT